MRLPSLDNFRSPAALFRFFGVCLLGLGADLFTKVWAFRALRVRGDGYEFIPGWLHFEVTTNHGAVFGLGQGQRWLFVCVSLAAILFLSWLFATSERKQWLYQVLLGILLAGVLGNLYDRIRLGYVRDMIHALPGWKWPNSQADVFPYIFNVADSLLCAGVFLMIAYSLFQRPAEKPQPQLNPDERSC